MEEFERITAIKRLLGTARSPQVQVGIGDDAAVLRPAMGGHVVSVDAAVEGVHFRFDFGPARLLGRRAAVAALSDLAAMGARPMAMLNSLLVPDQTREAQWMEVVRGLGDASLEYGAPVVGGNLSAAREFSLTTTVLGELPGPPLVRSGARQGDQLFCSGPVGAAALGLQLCLRGMHSDPTDPFVHRFLSPSAEIELGLSLAGVATACIDVSDGLLQDLGHLCGASNVGAIVDADQLPLLPGFKTHAERLGLDPLALALSGGDDYVLLFSAPSDAQLPRPVRRIGVISDQSTGIRVERAGVPQPEYASISGYRHFSRVR